MATTLISKYFFFSLSFSSFRSSRNVMQHFMIHHIFGSREKVQLFARGRISKNIKKLDARKPSQSGSENARDAERKIKAQCIKVARWCYLSPLIMLQMIKAEKWSTKTWCCNPFIAVSEPFEAYLMTFRVNCNFL